MSFFECEFPRKIAFFDTTGGMTGGPSWSTIVNSGFSGFEQRNRNWASSRASYQLDLVMQPVSVYATVLNFFEVVGGKADAFRFFDATDFQFSGQGMSPAVGDGVNKVFQLQKTYASGSGAVGRSYIRTISKPIMSKLTPGGAALTDFSGVQLADTVVAYLNLVKQSAGAFTVDATTGLVTFVTAPGVGVVPTADAQFHVPVRFDSDSWPAQVQPSPVANADVAGGSSTPGGSALVSVTGISLIEVRISPGQSQG